MCNEEIRTLAKNNKVAFWQIADYIGVCECTVARWMRHELTADRRDQVIEAITTIRAREE